MYINKQYDKIKQWEYNKYINNLFINRYNKSNIRELITIYLRAISAQENVRCVENYLWFVG